MKKQKYHDMNWSVNFEIVIDSCEASWDDLDEAAQEYILEQIREGYISGTTSGVSLAKEM